MAENSAIEWTDATASPWHGCDRESPGCDNCYAAAMSKRNPQTIVEWGEGGYRVRSASFSATLRKLNARGEREGRVISVFPSVCDPFEDFAGEIRDHHGNQLRLCRNCWKEFTVPAGSFPDDPLTCDHCHTGALQRLVTLDDLRRDMFREIDRLPWVRLLLLTKRPQNVDRMWLRRREYMDTSPCLVSDFFRPNVWLGTSVENQDYIGRLNHLHDAKRYGLVTTTFVSAEPLLGPLVLQGPSGGLAHNHLGDGGIDWIIVGGESGPHARPMHPDWARSLRDQCTDAGVPFFCKQGSGPKSGQQYDIPDDLFSVKEFPQCHTKTQK